MEWKPPNAYKRGNILQCKRRQINNIKYGKHILGIRHDFVIVCGDFGIWRDSEKERWWLKWLNLKPFTILFVDGNHENFDRLYGGEFEVVDFHGGKAHKIRDNIYHLMRGYVFDICGKKIFAFGGASSHDIDDGILDRDNFNTDEEFKAEYNRLRDSDAYFRVNHYSWWKEELPSDDEIKRGFYNLKQNDNKVDFIISHCAPQQVASMAGFFRPDILTNYFDEIADKVTFSKWFFGHYHEDRQIMLNFIMLYLQIIRVA